KVWSFALGVLLSCQLIEDALAALPGVYRLGLADKDGDGAPIGERLLDQSPHLVARLDIVGADVTAATRVRGVVVHRDQRDLVGHLVEEVLLIDRVIDADGDPLDPAGEKVVNDLLLLVNRPTLGLLEHDGDLGFAGGDTRPGLGKGPELL